MIIMIPETSVTVTAVLQVVQLEYIYLAKLCLRVCY